MEGLAGFLLVGLYLEFGFAPSLMVNGIFLALLLVLIFIDLDQRILPDIFTKGGIVAGLLLSPWQKREFLNLPFLDLFGNHFLDRFLYPLLGSGAGILFGAGFLWGVAWLYLKIRKIEGMGFGDVKMIAMIGAFIGWELTWLTILLGSLLGALVGGGYIFLKKKDSKYELPFGTFLGLAAGGAVFFGMEIIDWYFDLLRF